MTPIQHVRSDRLGLTRHMPQLVQSSWRCSHDRITVLVAYSVTKVPRFRAVFTVPIKLLHAKEAKLNSAIALDVVVVVNAKIPTHALGTLARVEAFLAMDGSGRRSLIFIVDDRIGPVFGALGADSWIGLHCLLRG
eukprot:2888932-Prymnesium_polylepis.1